MIDGNTDRREQTPQHREAAARWLSWVIGAVLFIGVVVLTVRFSGEKQFVLIFARANPWLCGLALALQAMTYLAHGQIWRNVTGAAGFSLPSGAVYRLSLAKLFVDQAIPSGGISGTVLFARALQRRGIPRRIVMAAVSVVTVSYYAAYALCLLLTVITLLLHGHLTRLLTLIVVTFVVFCAALIAVVLVTSGRNHGRVAGRLSRLRPLRRPFELLREADPHLARNPRLLLAAVLLQLAVVLLDTTTFWVLIQSLGATASPVSVFGSFMVSSVFRSIGMLPGGLGAFEASSVLTLTLAGVALPIALSATLLFRGLSLWLPMIPGVWFSRRAMIWHPREVHRQQLEQYWTLDAAEAMRRLHSGREGLSAEEASARLREFGRNEVKEHHPLTRLRVLVAQFRNPLLLLLVFAAAAAAATGEWIDSIIVLIIVLASVAIGYSREYSAHAAAEVLRRRIHLRAGVLRDGRAVLVPAEKVIPGDVILLSAGSLVPADALIIEAAHFFVSEAMLTGESFPVEKRAGVAAATATLTERSNCVFLGTNVRSGTAQCVVVNTGKFTQFGMVAERLTLRPPLTEFDRGIRRFGYLLTSAMMVMVLLVFVAHMFRGRPPVETLLFAIALAVGLSPELLPAILSVNLARGAAMMANRGVLVRRLNAIENLGSMDVLCTDKTGTLTEGEVRLEGAYDHTSAASEHVLQLAAKNAALETGLASPLDDAILRACTPVLSGIQKLAEIPFDFVRKRVSVIISESGQALLITKGAFHQVLENCSRINGGNPLGPTESRQLETRFREWSGRGIRVLAVATKQIVAKPAFVRDDERDLEFRGFLTFLDRPKEGAAEAIANLAKLGVAVKVVTGDSSLVAQYIAGLVGLHSHRVLTGAQLARLTDEALWHAAPRTDLFVEVDPTQKERIIVSLKKTGHVVGFLGDGVNDAPAMHAADTSLSVEQAADVAREAADFVLLDRDLDVIRGGIEEGRKTFANTLKYVLTTTSANLGNMVSMAAASLFLPFLPLTAGQILLNNFLSDIPAFGLATDRVDAEMVQRPRRWDLRFIGRFMIEFGMLSSLFDLLTFVALLHVFGATADVFRTGWFLESLLTELVVALVMRTWRPFFRSRPGNILLVSTLCLIVLAFIIPFLPFSRLIGFVPIRASLLATIGGIAVLYVIATEAVKRWFYRNAEGRTRHRSVALAPKQCAV